MTNLSRITSKITKFIFRLFCLILGLHVLFILFLLAAGTYKVMLSWTLLDVSQEYKKIDAYEGIVLKDYNKQKAYKRSFCGLTETDEPADFSYHGEHLNSTAHDTLQRLAPGNAGHIGQCTLSPDGRRILYVKANPSDEADPTDIVDYSYNVLNLDDGTVLEYFRNPRAGLGVEWH